MTRKLVEQIAVYGFSPPDDKDPLAAALKMADKTWWVGRLRQLQSQYHDTISRDLGFVSKKCDSYSGYNTVLLHRAQQERSKTYLQNTE